MTLPKLQVIELLQDVGLTGTSGTESPVENATPEESEHCSQSVWMGWPKSWRTETAVTQSLLVRQATKEKLVSSLHYR